MPAILRDARQARCACVAPRNTCIRTRQGQVRGGWHTLPSRQLASSADPAAPAAEHAPPIAMTTRFPVPLHLFATMLALASPAIRAQGVAAPAAGWTSCAAIAQDATARLACFDRWAAAQVPPADTPPRPAAAGTAAMASTTPAAESGTVANPAVAASGDQALQPAGSLRPCTDPRSSGLSRFWELGARRT
jgi:hypothetical protein